jgi:hypothetical protein
MQVKGERVSEKSNFDRLHEAGVLNAANFSDQDKQALENLSPEETDTLIKLKQKMGDVPSGKDQLRPNFPV